MIDIKLIRENPKLVKENIKKKFQKEKLPLVDKISKLDVEWRKKKFELDSLKADRNKVSAAINTAKKEKKPLKPLIEKAKSIPKKIDKLQGDVDKLQVELVQLLSQIPNIIEEKVPIGPDDSHNKQREKHGEIPKFSFTPKHHIALGEALGQLDFENSAKTSGKGFYYLKNDLALLNQALIQHSIKKMVSEGFTYIETPLMLRQKVINNVTDLHDQENQIYKIEGEDLYLIGTSEHSLIGRFIDTILQEEQLPILNASYSMCFRKETGAHGITEKGLYRTHQFNKVEMIVICKPEESKKYFEKLKKITVDIFKDLKVPTRVLEMCSGDLGELKHKQVDVEAYSPITKEYYEVGSCSNLTSAQARKLGIRTINKKGEKYTPHTLNNTAIATSRAIVAIMETHQQKDGSIKIPKALQAYMMDKKVISVKN
ncbi:serine--tRNA ligase [Candidatus Woesearchaeota archaeon]|nr:serine--tRNA ligase [Candidatus Woesearchaeota archaeon]